MYIITTKCRVLPLSLQKDFEDYFDISKIFSRSSPPENNATIMLSDIIYTFLRP